MKILKVKNHFKQKQNSLLKSCMSIDNEVHFIISKESSHHQVIIILKF